MVDRVYVKELYSRLSVKLVGRNLLKDLFHDSFCSLVSVIDGIFKQFPVLVEKPEVNAPRVYSDRGYVPVARVDAFENALLDLVEQAENVPVERSVYHDGVV